MLGPSLQICLNMKTGRLGSNFNHASHSIALEAYRPCICHWLQKLRQRAMKLRHLHMLDIQL